MSGVRMHAAWQPLDEEHVAEVGGHMGVYELASAQGEVVFVGFAGGRSAFGLGGELRGRLRATDGRGVAFRCEITTAYLSRYQELLMVHVADHESVPVENVPNCPELGRLSPA
jgi:hypothetical protein